LTNGKTETHSYLLQYREEIKAGKIIAGEELIQCLDNLAEDLEDERYYYDLAAGHRKIEFVEKFCKQTKAPFFGKPLKLELWEKAFVEALYSFKIEATGFRRFKKAIGAYDWTWRTGYCVQQQR